VANLETRQLSRTHRKSLVAPGYPFSCVSKQTYFVVRENGSEGQHLGSEAVLAFLTVPQFAPPEPLSNWGRAE
jgi:hypothetical protein